MLAGSTPQPEESFKVGRRGAPTRHAGVVRIRPATWEDGETLRTIEREAGERFREIGMPDIAEDDPLSIEQLARYAGAGRSWVAVDDGGEPIAYVIVDIVDGNAHVEQISVRPAHQGTGIGRALLDHVGAWAVASGRSAMTLTTFTDVPWNAPLYEHLGFRVLAEHEIGPELRGLRDAEATHGLDPATRVCMRRDLR
jgi:GNAT superfamily N-acetyltransferase